MSVDVRYKGGNDYPGPLQWLMDRLSTLVAEATAALESEYNPERVEDWQAELQRQLMRYYTAAYMVGAGETELDDQGRRAVMDGMRGQIGFLREFGVEMKSGAAWQNSWNARAKMYAKSIAAPYWRGRTKLLPLPAMPADGTTQCKTNCKCRWDVVVVDERAGDYDAYWKLSDAEHCQTCVQRAQDWAPLRIRGGYVGPGPAPEERWLDFGDDTRKALDWANEHFLQWSKDLPPNLREAVRIYTGAGYRALNKWLRTGQTLGEPPERLQQLRDELDAALARSPGLSEHVILYRGQNLEQLVGVTDPDEARRLLIGQVMQDEGYGSTSLVRSASFVADALLRIRAPAGTPGAYVSFQGLGITTEYEFLLARGYTYRVLDVQREGGGWTMDVEIIPVSEQEIGKERAARPSLRELLKRSPSMRDALDKAFTPHPDKFVVNWDELKVIKPATGARP